MGNRGTDIEEFLMKYPHMLRWVNECLSCHHKGYKPEMPSGITQNRPVRVTSKPANGEGSGH
jgi:hypothetical protein